MTPAAFLPAPGHPHFLHQPPGLGREPRLAACPAFQMRGGAGKTEVTSASSETSSRSTCIPEGGPTQSGASERTQLVPAPSQGPLPTSHSGRTSLCTLPEAGRPTPRSWGFPEGQVEGRCLVWTRGKVGCLLVQEERGSVRLSLLQDLRSPGRSSCLGASFP